MAIARFFQRILYPNIQLMQMWMRCGISHRLEILEILLNEKYQLVMAQAARTSNQTSINRVTLYRQLHTLAQQKSLSEVMQFLENNIEHIAEDKNLKSLLAEYFSVYSDFWDEGNNLLTPDLEKLFTLKNVLQEFYARQLHYFLSQMEAVLKKIKSIDSIYDLENIFSEAEYLEQWITSGTAADIEQINSLMLQVFNKISPDALSATWQYFLLKLEKMLKFFDNDDKLYWIEVIKFAKELHPNLADITDSCLLQINSEPTANSFQCQSNAKDIYALALHIQGQEKFAKIYQKQPIAWNLLAKQPLDNIHGYVAQILPDILKYFFDRNQRFSDITFELLNNFKSYLSNDELVSILHGTIFAVQAEGLKFQKQDFLTFQQIYSYWLATNKSQLLNELNSQNCQPRLL